MQVYIVRYHNDRVNISRSAPLFSGDSNLFFILSLSICEFAGTRAPETGRVRGVKLCDRRFSLRPDVLIMQQRARRGRPQVWKEIVKP